MGQLEATAVLKQIDAALHEWRLLAKKSQFDDCSDQPEPQITHILTTLYATIERFAPDRSHYIDAARSLLKTSGVGNAYALPHLVGILDALRSAYAAGYLATISELVHADTFNDMLSMAEYLCEQGYKDPAAVMGGCVLEQHLRNLATKLNLPTDTGDRPKKADLLNGELAASGAYSKLDQKSVTAWLDLRNKAAHAHYDMYTSSQVILLLHAVRNFVARVPA